MYLISQFSLSIVYRFLLLLIAFIHIKKVIQKYFLTAYFLTAYNLKNFFFTLT